MYYGVCNGDARKISWCEHWMAEIVRVLSRLELKLSEEFG